MPQKEDFNISEDKIGPLRQKLMCYSNTSAAIFNHIGYCMLATETEDNYSDCSEGE